VRLCVERQQIIPHHANVELLLPVSSWGVSTYIFAYCSGRCRCLQCISALDSVSAYCTQQTSASISLLWFHLPWSPEPIRFIVPDELNLADMEKTLWADTNKLPPAQNDWISHKYSRKRAINTFIGHKYAMSNSSGIKQYEFHPFSEENVQTVHSNPSNNPREDRSSTCFFQIKLLMRKLQMKLLFPSSRMIFILLFLQDRAFGHGRKKKCKSKQKCRLFVPPLAKKHEF